MKLILLYVSVWTVLFVYHSTSQPVYYKKVMSSSESCAMLKVNVLMTIHGGAFNERYMSVRTPKLTASKGTVITLKRAADMPKSLPNSSILWDSANGMHTSDLVSQERNVQYAWEIARPFDTNRLKRGRDRVKAPWDCGETVEWVDLGREYFPRFLRTVKCLCETCWYNSYQCIPRSFPINVLRKRENECVKVPERYETYLEVNAGETVEAWIWEEQYINVSCECIFSPK